MCRRCGDPSLALLLLALLAAGVTGLSGVTTHDTPFAPKSDRKYNAIRVHQCRSLEMEQFTCWWKPKPEERADNYALRYYTQNDHSADNITASECPDYTTGGPNSCYFNKNFTSLFTEYCFTVWDKTEPYVENLQQWNCTTVADITQPSPPRNLSWESVNKHSEVRLRWKPPPEPDLHSGWMSLVYQIRYRNNGSLNWTLREEPLTVTHHDIVGPKPKWPVEVQVRCKPNVRGVWSEWSESLLVVIAGFDLLQLLLGLGVLASCCLVAILLLLLLLRYRTRLTKWLFPPVPSPRIRGIDPDMLKKGPVEEINRMISSFHGFVSPVVHDDPWLEVTEVTCERDTLLAKVKGWRSAGPATPTHARAKRPGEIAAAATEPDLLSYLRGDLSPSVPPPENSAEPTPDADGENDGDGRNKRGGEAERAAPAAPPGECYTQVWDVSPDGTVCLASPAAAQGPRPLRSASLSSAPVAADSSGAKESGEPPASVGGDATTAPPADPRPPPGTGGAPRARPHPAPLDLRAPSPAPTPPSPPQSGPLGGSGRDAAADPRGDGAASDAAPLRSPDSPPPVPDYTAVHAVDAHQRLFLDARTDVAKGSGDAHKGYLPPEQLRALLLATAGVGVGTGGTQGYVGEERARFARS